MVVEVEPLNWERSVLEGEGTVCGACAHLRPDNTCAAFPDRIPLIIASGEVDHWVKRPGQVGDYVFELAMTDERWRFGQAARWRSRLAALAAERSRGIPKAVSART